MPDAPPMCCEDVDLDMHAFLCVERNNGALIGLEHTTPSLAQTQDEYTQLVQGMRVRVPFDDLNRIECAARFRSQLTDPGILSITSGPDKDLVDSIVLHITFSQ